MRLAKRRGKGMSIIERHNIKQAGSGAKAMVFAHGFGCDQHMWRYVAPAFEDRYRTILFDHIGAGGSDVSAYDPERYTSLHGYASDVVELSRTLKVHGGIFVGHSVSAMIGVLAAKKAPELFDKLIMVCPSPRYIDDGDYVGGFSEAQIQELLDFLDDNYLGWSQTMAPAIMGNPDRPLLGEELASSFCRTDPEIAKRFARATFLSDNRADLADVQAHCLVIQCAEDVIAQQSVGEYVHNHLPRSEFALIEATGHCPNLSAPEVTVAAINAFL